MGLKCLISHSLLEMCESLQSAFVKYLLYRYDTFLWKQKQSEKFLDYLMNPEAHFNAKPHVAELRGLQTTPTAAESGEEYLQHCAQL